MMRKTVLSIVVAAAISFSGIVVAGEGKALPAPNTSGGKPVLEALSLRGSGAAFTGAVSDADLATVLWAATGRNREDGGWTVPLAMGKPPYCTVYVVGKDGAFRYDWKNHSLIKVNDADLREPIGMQGFVKSSYYNLVMVINGAEAKAVGKQNWLEYGSYAVGAMTQNIYLAAGALGLNARFVISINKNEVIKGLGLEGDDTPVCVMVLGKP